MHAIFFGVKRAFQASLRLTRRGLAALGLTAARFDMLFMLRGLSGPGILQRELRLGLGVSAPVVSRMLKALEALGLVSRELCLQDRRQRWVKLTALGRSRVQILEWRMIRSGLVQLAVESALAGSRCFDESACFVATDNADTVLWNMRHTYRDTATMLYPWHPDD